MKQFTILLLVSLVASFLITSLVSFLFGTTLSFMFATPFPYFIILCSLFIGGGIMENETK